MILKKPYAFLIKYFKVIHFLIAIFLGLTAYKFNAVVSFFNSYVKNGYTTTVINNLRGLYTPLTLYLLLLICIILTSLVLLLLLHKKKPTLLYIITITYYVIVFIGLFYISAVLDSFTTSLLEAKTARSIRDILFIIQVPQYLLIIIMIIRGLGFDLKKFDFVNDLKDLDLSFSDSEEIEVNIDLKGYKVEQKTRRTIRELKYYIKENKFVVICISIILFIIFGYYIHSNYSGTYDKKYSINTTFIHNNLRLTVGNSMISNINYKGIEINKGKYYVAVDLSISNPTNKAITYDINAYKLEVGGKSINPTTKYIPSFIDFGDETVTKSVVAFKDKKLVLVYEINSSDTRKSMRIAINNGVVQKKEKFINKFIFVKIKPVIINSENKVKNYKAGDIINFSDTYLGNSKLIIKEYTLTKKYLYSYESCIFEKCKEYKDMIVLPASSDRSNNYVLILKNEFELDKMANYSKLYQDPGTFAKIFMMLQYKVEKKVYQSNVVNITPMNAKDFIALEVPKETNEASVIQLLIIIRNRTYIINIKG